MELEQQIRDIFQQNLPGVRLEIGRDKNTELIGGYVIWECFKGSQSLKRQNRVYRILRQNIDPADAQKNISFLFTYTPEEYEEYIEG